MHLSHRRFLVLFLLVALSSVAVSQEVAKTSSSKVSSTVNGSKIDADNFPEIEGWTKGKVSKFPDKKLGFAVPYSSPAGGRVTIYVFDKGIENIPDGADNDIVRNEMDRAMDEVGKVVEAGYYESYKVKEKAKIQTLDKKEGKLKGIGIIFNIVARGQTLTSETFIFGLEKKLVKFRMTRGEDVEGLENRAVAALKKALDNYFSGNDSKEKSEEKN